MIWWKMFNIIQFSATLLVFLSATVRTSLQQDDSLLVTLPNGQIRGHELQSTKNNVYYAFQEIPFAAPPVGDLRFKEPVAAATWNDTLNATKNTKICYQTSASSTPNVTETEDCLYLNVYTPVQPGANASNLLPVLFWIYGGSFRTGDGTYQLYGPDHFMDYDIIVVTINYRLGPFGFLTTEDGIIPGNLGLKDQNFALNWTYQNIELFGGDPNKITIVGESAGAGSVGYLLLSEKSSGLFRGAILESGTVLNSWARQPFSRYYAYQLGSALSSNFNENNSSRDLLELLLNSSASDIINADVTVTPGKENGVGPNQNLIWAPVIEDETLDSNALVVGPMEENLKNGNLNKVSTLIGFNSEEALLFLRGVEEPLLSTYLAYVGGYFDEDVSRLINNNFNMTPEDKTEAGQELRKLYTDYFINNQSAVIKFLSDQAYTTPGSKHAKLQSNYTDVYLYQFSYHGTLAGTNPTIEGTDAVGHTEELYYMWDLYHATDINTMPESDILTHHRLLTLWTNFVKYLNPTPTEDPLLENITWPKVSPDNIRYLNINLTSEVKTDPKKLKEWEPIIEKYAIPPLINY